MSSYKKSVMSDISKDVWYMHNKKKMTVTEIANELGIPKDDVRKAMTDFWDRNKY